MISSLINTLAYVIIRLARKGVKPTHASVGRIFRRTLRQFSKEVVC